MQNRIKIITGDITQLHVDTIVNAANTTLLGGGGVDGAIHRVSGPELLAECRTLGGCPTGEARLTKGYKLPCRFVIHTVGPVWQDGQQNEKKLLASCYRNCLELTKTHQIETIAFPAISTGIYRFPKKQAAIIALTETKQWILSNEWPRQIIFCCFSEDDRRIYVEQSANLF